MTMTRLLIVLAAAAAAASAAEFATDIQPFLEQKCLHCHKVDRALGGVDVSSREAMVEEGSLVPGNPGESTLYTSMLPDAKSLMPPGGGVEDETLEAFKAWIADGAEWPDGLVLGDEPKAKAAAPDQRELVKAIRGRILNHSRQEKAEPYEESIPGTSARFTMTPIPGGSFQMGSPETEVGRNADEGPRHEVEVDPFWMATHEVTWDLYRLFMFSEMAKEAERPDKLVDGISRPTRPYVEMSFGMGLDGYPAISMTQHAARKFTQWLSAKTGHFYRLPTEAEWEYACRAGADTAYSFGDDPAQIGEYAVYWDNADYKYGEVGKKKPNAWGLYDMHGNVMEWVLDSYVKTGYGDGAARDNPLVKPTELYPRVARGGSWNDDADKLRCSARVASNAEWKMQDPQLPQSIWYHTDAQGLGFRIVRPVEIPSADEMYQYWNNGRPTN